MRLNNIVKALAAAGIAAAVLAAPFWWNALRDMKQKAPAPEKPLVEKECVLPAAEMRATHMVLLNKWRDEVVRGGDRTPVTVGAMRFEKSLTGACLKCHVDKEKFCDRCHTSLSSHPECFNCHIDTSGRPL